MRSDHCFEKFRIIWFLKIGKAWTKLLLKWRLPEGNTVHLAYFLENNQVAYLYTTKLLVSVWLFVNFSSARRCLTEQLFLNQCTLDELIYVRHPKSRSHDPNGIETWQSCGLFNAAAIRWLSFLMLPPNFIARKVSGEDSRKSKIISSPSAFFAHPRSFCVFDLQRKHFWSNDTRARGLSTNLINLWKGRCKTRTCRFVGIDSPDLFCVKSLLRIIFTSTVFFSI